MTATNDIILAGDIGATHARFACLEHASAGHWNARDFSKVNLTSYANFDAALKGYMTGLELRSAKNNSAQIRPSKAVFAAAGPVEAGYVKLTNADWSITSERVKTVYGFEVCALYNDFAGMTRSVVELPDEDFIELRQGRPYPKAPILVAGVGTGFGVGYLIPVQNSSSKLKWQVISTEGGRIAYSPLTALEFELSRILQREYDFVSLERVTSGKALAIIHKAICEIHGATYIAMPPDLIRKHAEADDLICGDLCRVRAAATMTAIGDLALSGGARGGIVLAGGVSERMVDFYTKPAAMNRYLQRAELSDYVYNIPMRMLKSPLAPLIGAAALLRDNS